MKEISAGHSSTSCWTCRRHRVKCDRWLPECHRCSISGDYCQGYGEAKPLRWTNGVASRGKLMGKSLPITHEGNAPIATLLLDPVLQDLSPTNRRYIKYFDQYCSVESVLYDSNATNPFREFMRLIPSSSTLLHTIISVAALHQARRKIECRSIKFQQLSDVENGAVPRELGCAMITPEQLSAIDDALTHKQHALKHMQKELISLDSCNIDGTIASILLLVWQDLMDSGKESWKYHLDALNGIVQTRICSPNSRNTKMQGFDISSLYKHFEMTYAVFQILGTTFVRSKQSYLPLFSMSPTIQIMKLSDGQSWAGCPAELLYIISLLNHISRCQSLDSGLKAHILSAFEEFSPMKWAISNGKTCLMKSRYHLASVYKEAVAIYMSQVINLLYESNTVGIPVTVSLDPTIGHIRSISHEDAHFKSLVWPAFVIGAEAQQESQRMAIVQVFEHLWTIWRCQNVRDALDVLKYLWSRNDQRGYAGPWIGDLYGWELNLIFI